MLAFPTADAAYMTGGYELSLPSAAARVLHRQASLASVFEYSLHADSWVEVPTERSWRPVQARGRYVHCICTAVHCISVHYACVRLPLTKGRAYSLTLTPFQAFDWRSSEESGRLDAMAQVPPPPPPSPSHLPPSTPPLSLRRSPPTLHLLCTR